MKNEIRFTRSHEWIRLDEEEIGTVGITQFAQKELGEIVYIELPKVGKKIKASEEICVLESTKAAADIYAPVAGKIYQVNEAVKEAPSLVNRDAEGAGWLFKIEIKKSKEFEKLLTREAYLAIVGSS